MRLFTVSQTIITDKLIYSRENYSFLATGFLGHFFGWRSVSKREFPVALKLSLYLPPFRDIRPKTSARAHKQSVRCDVLHNLH